MKKNNFLAIFAAYIFIIIAGSTLIGLFSIQLFKYSFINSAQNRMRSNINLIKSSIENQEKSNIAIDYDSLAKRYSEDIRSTITFIDSNGNIVGEKIEGISKNKKFLELTEIVDAKQNGWGYNYFYDKELQVNILNVASKFKSNKFNGYIHLSTPLEEVNRANIGLMGYVLIGVIFIFFSSVLLRFLFKKNIVDPLSSIADNCIKVKGGGLENRVNIESNDILGVLADEYNSMIDGFQTQINQIKIDKEQMEGGLNNISIGAIVVDSEYRFIYANKFALKLFDSQLSSQNVAGKKVIEVIRDSKIIGAIKGAIEEGISQEIEIELEDGEKILSLSVKPMEVTKDNKKVGCFVTFYDISQIKKLEQMGSDFVSNVTHELRTPLTSIKGFVETLSNGAVEDKEVSYRFLEIINLECERLASLINDILLLAEIQNIKQDVNLGMHFIEDIVPEVVAFLENQARKKDIKIISHVQQNMPYVFINKNRIRQMLINLVDNAIKYTQIGGNVEINATSKGHDVILSIKDDGIGISEQALPRLFERFYRVDKGRSREQGGTGLGLAIVKHIVDLYNGSIEVKSEVGKGTEFVIVLPIRPR